MTRTRPLGFFGWLKHQRGTSTLEFAVVLPTLLIIFLGGLELARAWLTVNIATNAVREGARVAAASNPTLTGTNPVNYGFDNTTALARLHQLLSSADRPPCQSRAPRRRRRRRARRGARQIPRYRLRPP